MPKFLTVVDVAAVMRCSVNTVRRAIARGAIPSHRLPGTKFIRIDERDVIRLLGGNAIEHASAHPAAECAAAGAVQFQQGR